METNDTILIEINGEEAELTGTFKDGHANLTDVYGCTYKMTYPKFAELSTRRKEAIEDYINRPVECYYDIALKYGKLRKPMSKKDFINANNGTFDSLFWMKQIKKWIATKTINGEKVVMKLTTSYLHNVLKDVKKER